MKKVFDHSAGTRQVKEIAASAATNGKVPFARWGLGNNNGYGSVCQTKPDTWRNMPDPAVTLPVEEICLSSGSDEFTARVSLLDPGNGYVFHASTSTSGGAWPPGSGRPLGLWKAVDEESNQFDDLLSRCS